MHYNVITTGDNFVVLLLDCVVLDCTVSHLLSVVNIVDRCRKKHLAKTASINGWLAGTS